MPSLLLFYDLDNICYLFNLVKLNYLFSCRKEKSEEKSAAAAKKKSAKKNKFKKNLYRSGNKSGGFKKHTK